MARLIEWQCLVCKNKHALVRLNIKGGKSRLGVNCDIAGKMGQTTFVPLPKSTVEAMDENDPELREIPEFWTHPARRQTEEKQNYQLCLMNAAPGENLEGSVNLPRRDEDMARTAELNSQLAQLKQAQDELTKQIEKLAVKRGQLEQAEREARAKLREVYTEPLNLPETA